MGWGGGGGSGWRGTVGGWCGRAPYGCCCRVAFIRVQLISRTIGMIIDDK
jgi:hypothetical protein